MPDYKEIMDRRLAHGAYALASLTSMSLGTYGLVNVGDPKVTGSFIESGGSVEGLSTLILGAGISGLIATIFSSRE